MRGRKLLSPMCIPGGRNLQSPWMFQYLTFVTGNENETQAFDTNDDLNLPIAIRKGVRSCTHHPISQFVSFYHLSH